MERDQDTAAVIEQKLGAGLSPELLEIVDEGHLHAGHAGARSGGGHFALTVVSAEFQDMTMMQRHRLVYKLLAQEMKDSIHALALTTLTPQEWKDSPSGRRRTSTLG